MHMKYLYPTGSSPELSLGGSYAYITSHNELGLGMAKLCFSVFLCSSPKLIEIFSVVPSVSSLVLCLDLRSWLLEPRELCLSLLYDP